MPAWRISIIMAAVAAAVGTASARAADADAASGAITVVAARYPEALARRVDLALDGAAATEDQKLAIVLIMEAARDDLGRLRSREATLRTAMDAALQALVLETDRIEQLRREQVALAGEMSRQVARAWLATADVLKPAQRGIFFGRWTDERMDRRR